MMFTLYSSIAVVGGSTMFSGFDRCSRSLMAHTPYFMMIQFNDFIESFRAVNINFSNPMLSTYDHRVWKTGLPVRSAVLKPHAGELVVGWVTTSESSLLYVFVFASLSGPQRLA